MKKYILLLTFASFFVSCSEDSGRKSETADILGNWKLTEILIDPGDGSGTFEPYPENRTLEFLPNGKIFSNYHMCDITSNIVENVSYLGYYSADGNIIETECFVEGQNITYELVDGKLILHYPSYEGYSLKFVKVN